MKIASFITILLLLPVYTFAETIQLEPYDCGPLARGKLGVVFSVGKFGNGQTYFAEGDAVEICPKLMSSDSVSGYESNYCDNYEPVSENVCVTIKVFEIIDYLDDSNT
jgi:hypothetical protein